MVPVPDICLLYNTNILFYIPLPISPILPTKPANPGRSMSAAELRPNYNLGRPPGLHR